MFSLTYQQQLDDCVARKQWPRVVELCQLLLKERPDAGTYALMAKAMVHLGDDERAIAAYLTSLEIQPNSPNSHYALGGLFDRAQKTARAIGHYQAALQLAPDWFEAALKLGRLFHRLGDSAQAIDIYQSILEKDADCAEAHFAMGLLYQQTGSYALAVKCYRSAIFARSAYIVAYRRLGEVLVHLQAYDAATDVYMQAITLCPEDAALRSNLGQALAVQGESELAITAYQKAIELCLDQGPELDYRRAIAHQNLGRLCRSYQSTVQATSHFQQAFRLSPNNLSVLSDYTWQLIAAERWDDVLDCFRIACTGHSDFVSAYCQRTLNLPGAFSQGKCSPDDDLLFSVRRAAGRLLSSLQQSSAPATKDLKKSLAVLYEKVGDLSVAGDAPLSAERSYRSALSLSTSLSPRNTQLYAALGDCLLRQGRSAAAVMLYQVGQLQQNLAADAEAGDRTHLHDRLQSALQQSANAPTKQKKQPAPDCGGLTCQKCMTALSHKFSPMQVGKGAFKCRPARDVDGLTLPSFVTKVPDGRVWIAPKEDDWAVCNEIAVFRPDGALLGDVSRYYPWYLPGCDRHDIKNHPALHRQAPLPAVRHLPGTVAVLSGLSGHVYYHWLFDVLPRLGILQQHIALADIDYFVVNSLEKRFQKESLQAMNIPLEKIIASDQLPHIQAQQLVVPSFAGYLDWVPPATINFLRRTFLSSSDSAEPNPKALTGKRLYISRAQAKYRHVLNEDQVLSLLERFGIESVVLEQLTMAEQIRLFAQAEIIVAPHGSGLSNLAFCSSGTTVIELFSPYYVRTDYWMISEYLQLHHYYMIGKSFAFHPLRQLMYPSGLSEDFLIDIPALRSLLGQSGVAP